MRSNRWPVAACASVLAGTTEVLETAQQVALSGDGAVIVHSDGRIDETMVRLSQPSPAERRRLDELPYAGWMGARHMSALETSTREAVVAASTLSEEDGRVTVFSDGTFEDVQAASLGE